MNGPALLRKPKLYFDTAVHPSHVTFDDGKEQRRNFPWLHYDEGRWDYQEAEVIRLAIGKWVVLLRGINLGPLFVAIEEQVLIRVRAQPDLENDSEREMDTFVSEIRFCSVATKSSSERKVQSDGMELLIGECNKKTDT